MPLAKSFFEMNSTITWLGQSGYLLEYNNYRLVVDPYLSDVVFKRQGIHRLIDPPVSMEELRPDALLISHNHLDHFDPETVEQVRDRYPQCLIAGPQSVIDYARKLGIQEERLLSIAVGKHLMIGGFEVRATPAYHSDPFSVGFLIEVNDKLLYMTGDTLWKDTLAGDVRTLAGKAIDWLFIVINGKLGNMNWVEAVELTAQLRPTHAIPKHYGMFAENTEDPNLFIEACINQQIDARELILGQETDL